MKRFFEPTIPSPRSSHARPLNRRRAVLRVAFSACGLTAIVGCGVSTSTFVIKGPLQTRVLTAVTVRQVEVNPEFEAEYRTEFEKRLREELDDGARIRVTDNPGDAQMQIRYRPILLDSGSSAARVGSRAARAAVGFLLPISPVPDLGDGEVGVEATFMDSEENVVGRALIGAPVGGLFGTTSRSLSAVAQRLAEYTKASFVSNEANPTTKSAQSGIREFLPNPNAIADKSLLEPFIGVWDETWDLQVPGQPVERLRAQLTVTWEANRSVLLQQRLIMEGTLAASWLSVTAWDRAAGAFRVWSYDAALSSFHTFLMLYDASNGCWRYVPSEGQESRVLSGEIRFQDEGRVREMTVRLRATDDPKAVLEIKCHGRRRAT